MREGVASDNFVTDNNGEATIELEESINIRVELLSLDGWEEPRANKLTFGRQYTKTVELKKDTSITLTVTVVDQYGDAVVGAPVQLCVDTICLKATETNEDGEMSGKFEKEGKIKIKIVNLPDGYEKPSAIDSDGYHFHFESGETDIEIEITKN